MPIPNPSPATLIVSCLLVAAVGAAPTPAPVVTTTDALVFPPGFEEVLPKDVIRQLREIHGNPNLSKLEKDVKTTDIMTHLPDEVHDKLPPPPGTHMLPPEVQKKIKHIHKDKTLDFHGKHAAIKELIDNLHPDHKKLLPPPPPPPAHVQTHIKQIYHDTSLHHHERAAKIRQKLIEYHNTQEPKR